MKIIVTDTLQEPQHSVNGGRQWQEFGCGVLPGASGLSDGRGVGGQAWAPETWRFIIKGAVGVTVK